MTIAVDFDGVIHAYSRGWDDGSIYDPPLPGALDGLRHLLAAGPVFIHTTRNAKQVARWIEQQTGYSIECTTRMVPWLPSWWRWGRRCTFWNDTTGLLLVTDRKLPATAYLDDRAVRFTDWDHALTALGVTRRLLSCGLCYEEWGEEVHPHPDCPIGNAATLENQVFNALVKAMAPTLGIKLAGPLQRSHYESLTREVVTAIQDALATGARHGT
jgi:hypothetical protein